MSEKEISEAGKSFAAELNALARKMSEAEKWYREEVENAVLRHLKAEFPDYAFGPEYLQLENKSFWDVATYQENNKERFMMCQNGTVDRRDTALGHDYDRALYQAEGEFSVSLVMERTDRECRVQIYHKRSGERDTSTGYRLKTRLVHEDTYGCEYIVVNEENCYLESIRKGGK